MSPVATVIASSSLAYLASSFVPRTSDIPIRILLRVDPIARSACIQARRTSLSLFLVTTLFPLWKEKLFWSKIEQYSQFSGGLMALCYSILLSFIGLMLHDH